MMKRLATLLALVALSAAPAFAANAIRISQADGGGGGASGTYLFDYVELFNNGTTNVNIGGWALEYGSAAGNWGSSATNIFTFPANTIIQPCQYMLIQLGTAGTAGAPFPVPPDFTTTNLSMSNSNGKVALFNAVNANVACGAETPGTLVDKVAWGTGNCPEGIATAATVASQGLVRNNAGVTDTDNNLNDFTIVTAPVPRNSFSPKNPTCLVTPTKSATWGEVKSIYR